MDQNINDFKHQTWNNSYMLDIPMIDKQHMIFFKIFDHLLLLNKEHKNYEKINDVIQELEKYTHNHFNTEEALMRKANEPDVEQHILQHKLFIKKVEEFKIAYSYKNTILMEQMISFMRKWFLIHIAEVDGKYADSVREYLQSKDNKEAEK